MNKPELLNWLQEEFIILYGWAISASNPENSSITSMMTMSRRYGPGYRA